MPLSEQEQRLLDEMERHLMRNDADVVSAPRDGRALSYRNIVVGALLVLIGLGGLIAGVATNLIIVGVIAFLVMVAGVIFALTPTKGGSLGSAATDRPGAGPRPTAAKPQSGASFMDRMNARWDRRQDGDR